MKANEAPEKIFICNSGSELSYEWHSESEFETKGHNDIEYVRKDAFIEKACEFIAGSMTCGGYTLQKKAKFIRDFKKYMEL